MQHSLDVTRRCGAYALIGSAVAVVFAMAHHPTGFGGSLIPVIHGVMIVLAIVLFYGFLSMALWRGVHRPAVLAGITVYSFSAVCNIGAAILSGFVSPVLVTNGDVGTAAALNLSFEGNQALARWAVYLTGAAYVFFGVSYIRELGALHKTVGFVGILVGLLTVGALLIGHYAMTVQVALMIYSSHMAWALMAGIDLLRAGSSVSPVKN